MTDIEELQNFINNYIRRKVKFNIFKELGIEKGSENRHSNVLKWLLDKKGSHKLGNIFFNKFFKSLGFEKLPQEYEVEREKSSEAGRPDIVITSENFNCIIEVKFGASETNEQCRRYYEHKDFGKNFVYVYLDLGDVSYEKLKYKNGYCDEKFNFGEIYKLATFDKNVIPVLNNILSNEKEMEPNVKYTLEQYLSLLEEHYEMYKGEYIRNKIFDCQHPSKEEFKNIDDIEKEISENLKNITKDRTVNHYFETRRYELIKILFYVIKEKAQIKNSNYELSGVYDNKSLTINFKYKGILVKASNAYTKNNSQIKLDNDVLFEEDEFNEKLFYEKNNETVKDNFNNKLEEILEKQKKY